MAQVKPWYRKFNDTWYVQVGSRQIPLAKGKRNRHEAYQRFIQLMAQQDPAEVDDPAKINLASMSDAFLDWAKRHLSRRTYEWYQLYLQMFCDLYGTKKVLELKPLHVTRWLDGHENWGQTSRRSAITSVKRMLNWAADEGYIPNNPLRGLKRPPCGKRVVLISDEQHQQMLEASDKYFRPFLQALRETGARPGEITNVTAADVDLERRLWVLKEHKTAYKTERPRLILMTDSMLALTRERIEQWPEGPLFRNKLGQPWTVNSVRLRMQRLRKVLNLPANIVAYAYRHTYTTNGLANGVPVATMAELLGHSDTKMISAHYSHLSQRLDHLHQAARQVLQ
ncbi:tyrosine-type recombinase/integrase [Planctomicrobium piriforme]|uniref:Site-specific recombinase XerD n=1 Tax=Planctomicrobium piriforme TaxID=1576369 RepID=A0A1I3M715_9PLAN|nr:tyrosine-type recombinase/integrase [Planctomicrobium piriforme]SFI92486.1 Site-specific recombinase XerD [Planctomicrobium piriforme]